MPNADARLGDNSFDLEPGCRRVVTITSAASTLAPDAVTLGCWTAR